jgi:hypothetical protein
MKRKNNKMRGTKMSTDQIPDNLVTDEELQNGEQPQMNSR